MHHPGYVSLDFIALGLARTSKHTSAQSDVRKLQGPMGPVDGAVFKLQFGRRYLGGATATCPRTASGSAAPARPSTSS
eukprot:2820758-Alexandrium_andersonii.AAC.1